MSKSYRIICILFAILYAEPYRVFSQSALTVRDAREIQLLAQRKVERGLSDLLNTLTFDELGEFERKSIVEDSYRPSPNQIFFNDQVIIEDDLDPRHARGTLSLDLPVTKYLNNFDLFYPKSEEQTIHLTDLSVSNLKKSDYYYVKVYFTSSFSLRHKQVDLAFEPVARVAEVRAERNGKKWSVSIARLAFKDKNETDNRTLNDVDLVEDTPEDALADQTEKREQERETERIALEAYNKWLDAGDNAFNQKDYETALEAYSKADKLNVYEDLLPRRKIYKVKKAFETEGESQVVLLAGYLTKASLAQKNRNYGEAVSLLRKAQVLKPDSSEISELIRGLNEKSNAKTELDEKFNAGKYNEVIKRYNDILKTDKDNSDHYLGRGLAYFKNGDLSRGLKDFDKAIELDFANLAAFKARAELYAERKDFPKAIADLTNYLNIDPVNEVVLRLRAELRLLTQNHTGAKDDLDYAVRINPDNYQNYISRGKYYHIEGLIPFAREDFSTAIKLRPVSSEAYFLRGQCAFKDGHIENAGKDFQRALDLNPPREILQSISGLAKTFFDEGVRLNGAKRFDDAAVSFRKSTLIYPAYADAHFHLAENLLAQQHLNEAIEAFSHAVRHDPNSHKSYFKRGHTYKMLGNDIRAYEDFKKARLINTAYYMAFYEESNTLYRLKRYQDAAELLRFLSSNERKLGKDFDSETISKVYNRLGVCYFMLGDYNAALEEQSTSIKRNKQNSDAYYSRAQVYQAAEYYKKASADYLVASRYDPSDPSKKLSVGKVMVLAGSPKKALQYFGEAASLDSENKCCQTEALLSKADLLYYSEDFKNASLAYRTVVDVKHFNTSRLTNAGISCLMVRQTEAALHFLSVATEKPDKSAESMFAMACCYLQQFDKQLAQDWMERALKTGLIDKKYIKNSKLLNVSTKEKNTFKTLFDRYLQ